MKLIILLLGAGALCADDSLLSRSDVQKALAHIQATHEANIARQIEISQIPAPTFLERERAKFMAAEFRRLGLKDVEIDARNNAMGWRYGTSKRAIAIAAHLDTVFPMETDVRVKKSGNRLLGPGIADDARGLAALLALIEALDAGKIATTHSILFVANCCEEGLGNLEGVRYLLQEGRHKGRIDAFISIDGTDPSRIVNGALASKRYRITITGPGGHSWGNFGRANPAHALGRAIARFATLEVPGAPRTTYNIGKIGGGRSVNAIPEDAWMEVDMRSESAGELDKLEQALLAAVREAVAEENRLRAASGTRVEAENKLIGARYGGETPATDPLVVSTMWAARHLGLNPQLSISSTDANIPINMGKPAITVGGGGRSGNAHSESEWFEPEGAWKGVQQLLLAVLSWDKKTAVGLPTD
jgi:acetylornithine deacetylase/succinyl-diaminopimelate desuccinylase-like protein